MSFADRYHAKYGGDARFDKDLKRGEEAAIRAFREVDIKRQEERVLNAVETWAEAYEDMSSTTDEAAETVLKELKKLKELKGTNDTEATS